MTRILSAIAQGIRFTITFRPPRAFRRPPTGRIVAQTEPNPWIPKEPQAPPEWWPPDKELKP